ncbi:MAG: CHAT domain-containing protein [Leptolyngbyaceae cyanobacterium bins.302]|nr:CHAT domain-containing protein [Leptolyngbyaceae cyanobacterium bins.302]
MRRNTILKRVKRPFIRLVVLFLLTLSLGLALPGLIRLPAVASFISQSPSAVTLEQQARSRYQSKQFSEAAALFLQAAKAYQTAGDFMRQALSLSNLSLCHQQMGAWEEANRAILDSLAILQNQVDLSGRNSFVLAQALDIQADLLLSRGQARDALAIWERVISLHRQQGQANRVLESQTNQAKALQQLGLHRRAIALLQTALNLLAKDSDSLTTQLTNVVASPESAIALHQLGESLRVIGDLSQAKSVMERCLAIAQQLQLQDVIALAQLSLGNIAYGQTDFQTASTFYQQVVDQGSDSLRVQAQLNLLKLLMKTEQMVMAQRLLPQTQQRVEALPTSRASIEARINLAQTRIKLEDTPDLTAIAKSLATTVQQAKELGDPRLESYALGSLGSIYERSALRLKDATKRSQQWVAAEQLTRNALQLVRSRDAGELTYLWHWQLGRILNAEGKSEAAIASYQEAVSTIQSLRADLAAANPEVQFSFRDTVEPIHRQFVELLLQSTQPDRLKTARDIIESLQLVELDNFFREACLNTSPAQIDQVDQRAAVVYPILLEDQLAIITSFPPSANSTKRELQYAKTPVKRAEVENLVDILRDDLDQETASELTLPKLQQMYDWLLKPIAADLLTHPVETLVFVLDGKLRNIPIAALYDGQQFLVEKYSVALTPGLQLISPRSLKQESLSVFAAGLDAERSNFPPLPYVEREIQTIQSALPNRVLFNQTFTSTAFQQQITAIPFPIVHLATHGQFGGTAEETFILTWDGKLTVNQLSSTLQSGELSRTKPLELLILSACETADGDDRAALGLAGVAVRSGARSTVATLWQINDKATSSLMGKFYSELAQINKTGISKAEALRRAQLSILNDPQYKKQPYFWAAFVLIGNWT